MRTSAITKAAVMGIPTGLWLLLGAGSVLSGLAVAAGAALLTLAWVIFEIGRRPAQSAVEAAPARAEPRRIERAPSGRKGRDVRCSATRPTGRARRSTRR